MAKKLTISVAEEVYNRITQYMQNHNLSNKSEFIEECIRIGLADFENKEVDKDGIKGTDKQ